MEQVETVLDPDREVTPAQCGHLEAGGILLFPELHLDLSEEDCQFLLGQRQTGAAYHKNIAYRPATGVLTGVARGGNRDRLRRILGEYAQCAARRLASWLPRYARSWRVDFTSFRPFEEQGRDLTLHSRNDLLHVDAFPSRPTHGDRILRFFTNLNPHQSRVWITGDSFGTLAAAYAVEARLVEEARRSASPARRVLARAARLVRLRSLARSPYDALMHRFHNFLKENSRFQETCPKQRIEFPPRSSWVVFTDAASHAVLSGRFALEQTFFVSRRDLLRSELAPVSVLERITGAPLTWPA